MSCCSGCNHSCAKVSEGSCHSTGLAGGFLRELLGHKVLVLDLAIFLAFFVAGFIFEIPRGVLSAGYFAAWLLAIWGLLPEMAREFRDGNIFNEFTLMIIASGGAFYLGEPAEGAAVLVFYSIGELFQDMAVDHARESIVKMLDTSGDRIRVARGGASIETTVKEALPGDEVTLAPGEKAPLDGRLVSGSAVMNTAAVNGEPVPSELSAGDRIYAGMVNTSRECRMVVTSSWQEGSTSKILDSIQEASGRKSNVQRFMTRFASIYTPCVILLAVLVAAIPIAFGADAGASIQRGLVFLVVSCPCALVVSIPLGYFGGIGLASRNQLLFKGANYLDIASKINVVAFDKTGTLTRGELTVAETRSFPGAPGGWEEAAAALESRSTHPAAQAIANCSASEGISAAGEASDVEELPGMGLKGVVDGHEVLAGNARLFESRGIALPDVDSDLNCVFIAVDGRPAGCFLLDDALRPEAQAALDELFKAKVKTALLTGDRKASATRVAKRLGIDEVHAELMPGDKRDVLRKLKEGEGSVVAFVGDGINDAAVLAEADIGIAVGKNGSDLAIEAADLVIRDGDLRRIPMAMRIGSATRRVVWQNIALAFAVKIAVMGLSCLGEATLWEAVFADVGVALLAILNAVRIQNSRE